MLFQPTNITPSKRGGLGNWTVDVDKGEIPFSWMVNGNSAMVAFSITIYQNDARNTQVMTTGKLTSGCPFYGVDYEGNPRFFSYTVDISGRTGFTNGSEYKFVIRQWWGATDEESVTQSSPSVFVTRAAPTLTLSSIPSPVTTRAHTFTATYSQDQGDALNWVRWMIARSDNTDEPLYDTQSIYGTAQLQFAYDGLFSDTDYSVRCIVQTESGVEADTGWTNFNVSYSSETVSGYVTAVKSCKRSAVRVSTPFLAYIPGEVGSTESVDPEFSDGRMILTDPVAVFWSKINGQAMSIPAPWSFVVKYVIQESGSGGSAVPGAVRVRHSDGTGSNAFNVYYNATYNYLSVEMTDPTTSMSVTVFRMNDVPYDSTVTIALTPTALYIRVLDMSSGLVPSSSLSPSISLVPSEPAARIRTAVVPLEYTQQPIKSIMVSGPMTVYYIQVTGAELSSETVESILDDTYEPSFTGGTYMLTRFEDETLNAGFLTSYTEDMSIAVYREDAGQQEMSHIADIPASTPFVLQLYDYGARSQQGPYVYRVLGSDGTSFITTVIESDEVSPVFWDWCVLSCKERSKDRYEVEAEYRFRNNIVSGSISNNNNPAVLNNFTRYPTVQLSASNWQSGTLESLIGIVDFAGGQNAYSDTIELRDKIYALSTTRNTLFLKNRKGDLLKIRISGPITMETSDNTREQAIKMHLPWAEIGPADGAVLTCLPGDDYYEDGDR